MSDARLLFKLVAAAFQPTRPLIANLVVTRRCNLSCGYCFEYDNDSPPVPFETLKQRIDHLRRLRTVFVTLTGGETLLHPQAVELVAYVRERSRWLAISVDSSRASDLAPRRSASGYRWGFHGNRRLEKFTGC